MHDDVATAWTQERREALSGLDQGHVIEGLPFFYLGQRSGAAARPSTHLGPEAGIVCTPLDGPYTPAFGIITSQSCDLAEEADPSKRPWFLASPVYERTDYGERTKLNVELIGVRYLVKLTGARFQDSNWIADLRIQVPFDKAVLVGRQTYPGFENEGSGRAFALRLADLYSRPAFPTKVSTHVVESLRNWFHNRDKRIAAVRAAEVRRFGLRVSKSEPYDVQLLVLVDPSRSVDDAAKCLQEWYLKANPAAALVGLNLLPIEYGSVQTMSAATFLSYQPVALDYITQPTPRS